MSNTEWNERRPGAYSVWGENVHVHHTFEEEEEEYEEYDDEEYEGETTDEEEEVDYYSIYEEMLSDSIVRNVSLTDNAVRLSVSAPIFNVADGVSITFKHSDKATIKQEVIDGQLTLTVQENTALQSIKICVDNRTWTIPLDSFPVFPPSMPKKR